MAANLFGRYVWLVDTLRRHKRLTYEEINRLWRQSGLSYGEGDDLAIRTFHNHRKAIFDIFQVDIRCDAKAGYKYYIDCLEDLERDNLRLWLIDSYTAMNQIQADSRLQGRIIFENVPSGHKWMHTITDAMRGNYNGSDYLRTLPLHKSQVELTEMSDGETCYFKYEVCPTFDLYQALLAQADQIEVVSPESIRLEMRNFAKNLMAYYKD